MRFILPKKNENIVLLSKKLGYKLLKFDDWENEANLVRPLHGDNYPRFHLYLKEEENSWNCNLHLDQKKPSYEGSSAHSGEYSGKLVEEEAARIKGQMNSGL